MNWFLISLVAPLLWGVNNYIDKYLVSHYFKKEGIGVLMIFSSVIAIFLLPFIFIFKPDVLSIDLRSVFILFISAFIYLLAVWFYFIALKEDEASQVVPLFQFIPVFSYFLGLFFLGENLSLFKIFACLLVILSAVGLSFDFGKKMKFKNKVFWFMVLSSFSYAFNFFLFKFVALDVSFWTVTFWEYIGLVVCTLFLFLIPSLRVGFFRMLKINKGWVVGINFLNEMINVIAKTVLNFATLLAPLAVVWTVNGFHPFVVLFYGFVLSLILPKVFKEDFSKINLAKKVIFILIMFIGLYFLNK